MQAGPSGINSIHTVGIKSQRAEAIRAILPHISGLSVINRREHNPAAVKTLQNALWLLGYFFDPIDGGYGEITREALMYLQLENGVIHNPEDEGAGVLGPKTKEALGKALARKLREIETGENAKPGNLAGLTREEERRLARHSIYQNIGHSHNVQNRTFRGRLQDHEMLLDSIFSGANGGESAKILKDILLNPQTDGMFFIDIGPGIANKDLDVRGGRGKPAVSLQEFAGKFKGVQCFALDMPSEMDIFTGKTPEAVAGYTIASEDRNELLAKRNMHLIRGNGLTSLKDQLVSPRTNPYPERPRPTPTKNSTIIVRAANSIDLYGNWEKEILPALTKMAEDFKDNPVVLLFNREILVKPAHSATWKLVGQVSGMGFRHNDRALTRSGHPPFFLYEDKVRSLKKDSPLVDQISQISTGIEEGEQGEHVRTLQKALRSLGYFTGVITLNFGPKTKEALIKFQFAKGIIHDRHHRAAGVFGPKTKEALIKTINTSPLIQEDTSSIATTSATVRTRAYVNQNAPEYSALFRTSPHTLDSIGPLEVAIDHVFQKNDFFKKVQPITPEQRQALTKDRLRQQADYLQNLRSEFRATNSDRNMQANLYRMNGATRDYLDEVSELNTQLPPMNPECKMTIVLPSYHEEERIRKTLTDWISQVGPDGKPLDPKSFEIIVLINKPNAKASFDNTAREIDAFKREHPEYRISYVHKTFNFLPKGAEGEPKTQLVTINGQDVELRKGVIMGLVYKVCGDLAVIRNSRRPGVPPEVIADHLMRTGAADAYGRSPTLLRDVMGTFSSFPTLDQYKAGADVSPRVLEKIPVLHITQRYLESMNRLCADGTEVYGLGTYRAAVYSAAGGFNPTRATAEELDLSRRIRVTPSTKKPNNVWKSTSVNAAEDPRRRLYRMTEKRSTLNEYAGFGAEEEEKGVRALNVDVITTKNLPNHMQLTEENVGHFVTERFNYYFSTMFRNNVLLKENFAGCFARAKKLSTIALLSMGFQIDDFEIIANDSRDVVYEGNISDDPEKTVLGKLIRNPPGAGRIVIKNLSNIVEEIERFHSSPHPDWILRTR
ncbi:MAG: peptidoglycan-binding protein [Candidatus Gracilibacteria bacterium]